MSSHAESCSPESLPTSGACPDLDAATSAAHASLSRHYDQHHVEAWIAIQGSDHGHLQRKIDVLSRAANHHPGRFSADQAAPRSGSQRHLVLAEPAGSAGHEPAITSAPDLPTGPELMCCNGTYRRDPAGWRYPWGELVPGAADLTLADLHQMDIIIDGTIPPAAARRELTADERSFLAGDTETTVANIHPARMGATIVGMRAPELHAATMLTIGDIAELTGTSKATIDSYRHRGYLPAFQVLRGRTPLWARPIVLHWLATRPQAPDQPDANQTSKPRPDPRPPQQTDATARTSRSAPTAPRGTTSGATAASAAYLIKTGGRRLWSRADR